MNNEYGGNRRAPATAGLLNTTDDKNTHSTNYKHKNHKIRITYNNCKLSKKKKRTVSDNRQLQCAFEGKAGAREY